MLFEIAKALRSLSPASQAIAQARQQANRYVVAGHAHRAGGGAAVAPAGAAGGEDWPLPTDIDLAAVDAAITAKLDGSGGAPGTGRRAALHVGKNGKVLVPADYVRRIGDGDFGQGKRWLERAIADIRAHRALAAARRAVDGRD